MRSTVVIVMCRVAVGNGEPLSGQVDVRNKASCWIKLLMFDEYVWQP